MPDPRIQRTRAHVLSVARRLLSEPTSTPLNFTILSKEAQVSRRTLYTHWGTIDRVIGDAVAYRFTSENLDPIGETPAERVLEFLQLLRDRMADPVTKISLAGLVSRAAHDDGASDSLKSIAERGRAEFARYVQDVEVDQYEFIAGPVFQAQFISRVTMTDESLERLRDHVCAMLDISLSKASVSSI
jgi:AcrR family transcriptional regulator